MFSKSLANQNRTIHRRTRRKKPSLLSYLFIVGIIGAIIYGCYWIVMNTDVFEIKELEITGIPDSERILVFEKLSPEVVGEPFFRIDETKVESIFIEKLPEYKVQSTKYTFPSKLSVTLEERNAEYSVRSENRIFEVDSEGFVMGVASLSDFRSNGGIVDVFYDKALEVGETIKDSTLDAALRYSNLDQTVKIEDDEILIELSDGGKVILPKDSASKKVDEIFTLLQNIIQKYTIENRDVDLIDLRFSKPIIKYKE